MENEHEQKRENEMQTGILRLEAPGTYQVVCKRDYGSPIWDSSAYNRLYSLLKPRSYDAPKSGSPENSDTLRPLGLFEVLFEKHPS